MATPPASPSPLSADFSFRKIGVMGPYNVLIESFESRRRNKVIAGDIYKSETLPEFWINLNAGRTGTPGLEIMVTQGPSPGAQPVRTTVIFEPGVGDGVDSIGALKWRLHQFSATWLGRPGSSYDKDSKAVRDAPTSDKRRMLRITVQTFGFLSNDPLSISTVYNSLPAGSPAQTTLSRLTSGGEFNATMYFMVAEGQIDAFKNTVLKPFERACAVRPQPLHQYLDPDNLLKFDMERLPQFRSHMYATLNAGLYGPPYLQIADPRGRQEPRPLAVASGVGLIREVQAHEELCADIGSFFQGLRLVRSTYPLLGAATRYVPGAPSPDDKHVYLGYVHIEKLSESTPKVAPRKGEIFLVSWFKPRPNDRPIETGERAAARVLETTRADLGNHSSFVLQLLFVDRSVKARAAVSLDAAILVESEPVRLVHLQNRISASRQLELLGRFQHADFQALSRIVALQQQALHMTRQPQQETRPIHLGPDYPRDAGAVLALDRFYDELVRGMLSAGSMSNVTPHEILLLRDMPKQIDSFLQLVQVAADHPKFRAIYRLILALAARRPGLPGKGHQVIVAVEEAGDRAKVCHGLFRALHEVVGLSNDFQQAFKNVRLLTYTSTDIEFAIPRESSNVHAPANNAATAESDLANLTHLQAELAFKLTTDNFPSHSFILDPTGVYQNAAPSRPPNDQIPLVSCMGDALQYHFACHPEDAEQYFADRAMLVDGAKPPLKTLTRMADHHQKYVRSVLRETDILVTDYGTALNQDVTSSFPQPILFLVGADRVDFPCGAGVFLSYPHLAAAFILGFAGDNRHGRRRFTSRGRNEAWTTFERSFWAALSDPPGASSLDLT